MAAIVWVSMGTALWHFTIFMPDRFPGGIVGAFVWANMGALVVGLASGGFSRPSLAEVHLADAVEGLLRRRGWSRSRVRRRCAIAPRGAAAHRS
jgi:hypothetical protein